MEQVTQEQLVASAVKAFEQAKASRTIDEKVDKDYYSARQWTLMLKRKDIGATRKMLEAYVAEGLASKKNFKVKGQDTTHYKMKETK